MKIHQKSQNYIVKCILLMEKKIDSPRIIHDEERFAIEDMLISHLLSSLMTQSYQCSFTSTAQGHLIYSVNISLNRIGLILLPKSL